MTLRSLSGRAKAAVGASLLILAAVACDEDGKTAPDICSDPPLEIFDIQDPPSSGGEGGAGEVNPCVTPVGHAISPPSVSSGGMASNGVDDGGAGGA
jgi:hypothetical protein